MKIAGNATLNENLKIEATSKGTVELASTTPATNGSNLEVAVKSGIKNVEVTTDAEVSKKITLGNETTELKIDAEGATITNKANDGSLIEVTDAQNNVTVTGGTFKSGETTKEGSAEFRVNDGKLTLEEVTIDAGSKQYGVALNGSKGTLTINHSQITSNRFACLCTNGSETTGGTITLDTVIMENKSETLGKGDVVMYLPGKANVELKGCTLIGHFAGIQMLQGSLKVDATTEINVKTEAMTEWPTIGEIEGVGTKVDFTGGTKTICAKGQLVVIADDGYGENNDNLTLELNDTTFTDNVVVLESEESNHSETKNIKFTGINKDKVKFFTKEGKKTQKTKVTVGKDSIEVSNKKS